MKARTLNYTEQEHDADHLNLELLFSNSDIHHIQADVLQQYIR